MSNTTLQGNNLPRFLTIREVAQMEILPEFVLRRMCAEGLLPGFYSGKKFLINLPVFLEQLDDPESNFNNGGKRRK